MKSIRQFIFCIAVSLFCCSSSTKAQDKRSFTLPTLWTEKASQMEIPLPEYPRPQMERQEWLNLNGKWDYMGGKDKADPATVAAPPKFPATPEKILVPFAPEAELSGIARNGETNLWYQRFITVPDKWKGKRILLHFGAVDRIATIFINDRKVGSHTGGYGSFSFDITDYLKSGVNTLVVGAYDPNDGLAPSGKNGPRGDYTFSSGIWQTVWMEPVEKEYISGIKLIPDLKNNRLEVVATSSVGGLKVTATTTAAGSQVAKTEGVAGEKFYIPVKNPRLWCPEDPFLYDLNQELTNKRGKVGEVVDS